MICMECGKEVGVKERHTYQDCLKFKKKLENDWYMEVAKLYGNKFTYGQIIKHLKENFTRKNGGNKK